MIVVTGAAGFIGSCLVGALGRAGHQGLVAVDDFSRADKHANLAGKALAERVERTAFPAWLERRRRARARHRAPRRAAPTPRRWTSPIFEE